MDALGCCRSHGGVAVRRCARYRAVARASARSGSAPAVAAGHGNHRQQAAKDSKEDSGAEPMRRLVWVVSICALAGMASAPAQQFQLAVLDKLSAKPTETVNVTPHRALLELC